MFNHEMGFPSLTVYRRRMKKQRNKKDAPAPSKKTSKSHHRECARDVAPLLPAVKPGRPKQSYNALNEEDTSDDSPRSSPASRHVGSRSHVRSAPVWHHSVNLIGLLCVNIILFSSGACSIGFVLYYHNFFVTLWWSIFSAAVTFGVALMVHSVYGIVMLLLQRHSRILPFSITALCVAAAVMAVVSLHVVAWYRLDDDQTRSSLNGSFLSQQWVAAVNDGGNAQSSVCSIQRQLSCWGWRSGCVTVPDLSNHDMMEIIEVLTNITQLGNCPFCPSAVPSNGTQACSVAIANLLNASVWYMVGGCCVVILMLVANVCWAVRSTAYKRRAQLTVELLDAQRYL